MPNLAVCLQHDHRSATVHSPQYPLDGSETSFSFLAPTLYTHFLCGQYALLLLDMPFSRYIFNPHSQHGTRLKSPISCPNVHHSREDLLIRYQRQFLRLDLVRYRYNWTSFVHIDLCTHA
ncbi:hypothetical protein BJX68DRAFT_33709 [Aspergillus pseudodeflectus]|uniref:Uncharacterized protein n=1 Tax=Aspergillus pseudodeflectus TaxID=176178 RepID=A0ABR4KRT9_9EURO